MKKIFACILVVLGLFTICACNKVPTKTTSFDSGSVKMIAHRGLSGMEVENTESAFIEAGKRSYYGIESDVRKTRDGKFVMCHDATLTRIAGKNIDVETSTLEDLLKVPLLPKHEDDVKVEYLTTLERYIIICKEYDKQAILELKSIFTEAEIKTLALGAFTMTSELVVRFLDDYICGDQYFKTLYRGHNLVRTRAQLKLAECMYEKLDEMNAIVSEVSGIKF